jgi:hypothetical protein
MRNELIILFVFQYSMEQVDSLDAVVFSPHTAVDPMTSMITPLDPLTGRVEGFAAVLFQNAYNTSTLVQWNIAFCFVYIFNCNELCVCVCVCVCVFSVHVQLPTQADYPLYSVDTDFRYRFALSASISMPRN